jgi:hypothetical protein
MNANNESARLGESAGASTTLQTDAHFTTDRSEGDLPLCPACGSTARRTAPGNGPHYQRLECDPCGRFVKWVPRPREDAHE